MKKRLISFLLALSMMLSLVPAGAFAADTSSNTANITFSADGLPIGTGGTGWTYTNNTLKIKSGFSFANNADYPLIKCDVDNYGTIMGGVYKGKVTNHGTISFGIFALKPENKDGGTGTYYKISSSTGENLTFNKKLTASEAYTLATQSVTLTAPAGKVFSNGKNTYTISYFSGNIDVVLRDQTLIPLKIDSDGYPEGTENGTKDVYNGDGWKYENKTLTITDPSITLAETGTFPASYRITTSGAITSGTFKGSVTTTGAITGGTFEGSVTTTGAITGGTFEGSVATTGDVRGGSFLGDFTSANAPTGGIFAKQNNTALKLRKVSIQGGSKFTIPVNGVAHDFTEVYIPDETTITLNAPIALARMNGVAIPADQLSNDGKTVKITANGEDIVLDKALATPTPDLFNVYAPDVTYDGDPHGAEVYTKLANDLPTGVEPIGADFTVKYRLAGEGSDFTETKPANAGAYDVAVSFPAAGNYEGAEDLVLGQFTIDKKTITAEDFTFSAPANLTYDGTAKTATVTQANEVADSIIIQYTNAAGEVVTAPTNAGTYNVMLAITPDSNHKLADDSLLGNADWTFTIKKATLTANDFEMVGEGENRTIQPKDGHKGVTVDEVTWMPVESIATLSLDLDEMDSGTYQAYITVSAEENSNYKAPAGQLTDGSWTFSISKRDLTAADFTIKTPTYPDDRFDGSPKEVQPTYKGAVTIGEITVTYWKQNDASEWVAIEGAPVETGTYRFTLDVAGSPNNNPATGLRGDDWQFTIAEPLYHVYVEGGHAYYFDATMAKITIDDDTLVPAKVTVHLVADTGETADTDTEIALLTLDAEDEGTVDDFQWYIDPRTGSNLTEIANPTSRTDASFVMPRGDVYITTTNPNPEPEIVDSGAGTAVAVVLGGTAIGGVAYLAGTQLYLESVLPKGAAIPVNRQQLADLLWTAAGKPQPQNSVLFTDISAEAIDSQKAARWCVEQGLMPADGASFKPSRYTFRPQVIKAWNDLQAMQKAG